jgi:peptidoglycan/LPS O-acetylase OafA/YrhL
MTRRERRPWWRKHSLTLVASGILVVWIVLYAHSSSETHAGSFFGNAIADWTGLVVMVIATKYLYEKGSAESKNPKGILANRLGELLHEHSLTIFLLVTGAIWLALFVHMDAQGKWGQVVGNIVSEWTQILGLVLLTKRLIETGSKDSKDSR